MEDVIKGRGISAGIVNWPGLGVAVGGDGGLSLVVGFTVAVDGEVLGLVDAVIDGKNDGVMLIIVLGEVDGFELGAFDGIVLGVIILHASSTVT